MISSTDTLKPPEKAARQPMLAPAKTLDMGNSGTVGTVAAPAHGEPQSLDLILPPLSTIMLAPEG